MQDEEDEDSDVDVEHVGDSENESNDDMYQLMTAQRAYRDDDEIGVRLLLLFFFFF